MSNIYRIPASEIQKFLVEFDLESHFERTDPPRTGDEELRIIFEGHFGCVPAAIDRVYWFHLTRAIEGTDFRAGIKPLSQALDGVWETINTVFRGSAHESDLVALRKLGVPNWHYAEKSTNPIHGGPYAMLVLGVAEKSREIGNHDYLWLPEIMEDICNGYYEKHGERIHDTLNQALRPVAVKFWSTKRVGLRCVEAALYYLYLTAHGLRLSMYANTCFDGENEMIPPEQIVEIISVGG